MGYENGVINRIKAAFRRRRRRHEKRGKITGCVSFFFFFFFLVDWKLQYSRQFTIAEVHIITYWCRVLIFLFSTVTLTLPTRSTYSSQHCEWRNSIIFSVVRQYIIIFCPNWDFKKLKEEQNVEKIYAESHLIFIVFAAVCVCVFFLFSTPRVTIFFRLFMPQKCRKGGQKKKGTYIYTPIGSVRELLWHCLEVF